MTETSEKRLAHTVELARGVSGAGVIDCLIDQVNTAWKFDEWVIASPDFIGWLLQEYARLSPSPDRAQIEREAYERAAKVAEEYPVDVLQTWERPGGPPGNSWRRATRRDIAAAIRALKGLD